METLPLAPCCWGVTLATGTPPPPPPGLDTELGSWMARAPGTAPGWPVSWTGARLTPGGDKGKLTGSKGGTKPGSPTIVVSDTAKPVPFKPYENTKDVATAKAVESKRLSDTGSSKSSSPVHPDPRERDRAASESNRQATKSASPKQSASSSVR